MLEDKERWNWMFGGVKTFAFVSDGLHHSSGPSLHSTGHQHVGQTEVIL